MDFLESILVFLIVVLIIFLAIAGVYVILILRAIRKSLDRLNSSGNRREVDINIWGGNRYKILFRDIIKKLYLLPRLFTRLLFRKKS